MNQKLSTKIYRATYRAIRLIQESQASNGSFLDCSSIFANSIILRCLESLKHFDDAKEVRAQGVKFLLDKKSKNWSWNYWYDESRCPDDLDDTFSALSAIDLYDRTLITGEALAHISGILILCETETGGPYNTWIVQPSVPNTKNNTEDGKWRDVDIVVNSNIAYFLKLKGVRMPHLIEYTEKIIKDAVLNGKYESKYYDDLVILYFISRWYTGPLTKTIQSQVLRLRNPDGHWGNPLRDALAISVLTAIGTAPEIFVDAVTMLADSMTTLKTFPLYIESISAGQPKYAGSATLTAALCAEALSLFEQKYLQTQNISPTTESAENSIHEKIVSMVESVIDHFPSHIKSLANEILTKIQINREVTLMSYYFAPGLPTNIYIELGAANLFGWLAYTIYDDILDNEKSDLLPVANICFMRSLEIYRTVNDGNIDFLYKELILKMEQANAWEKEFYYLDDMEYVTINNIPKYKNYDLLADKSIPHSLGPISLYLTKEKDASILLEFFRHYLIARQLNDDAHDWLDDLKRGFVNSVGSLVLLEYFSKSRQKTLPSLSSLSQQNLRRLSNIFHHKILDMVSINILLEISQARICLEKIPPNWDTNYFKEMLKPLERSANRAVTERDSIAEFISTYSSSCESLVDSHLGL